MQKHNTHPFQFLDFLSRENLRVFAVDNGLAGEETDEEFVFHVQYGIGVLPCETAA